MESHVILTAKGSRIGQGAGGDEAAQWGSRADLSHEGTLQEIEWSFLEQTNQRFEWAEVQGIRAGRVSKKPGSESHIGSQNRPQGGDEGGLRDLGKEPPAVQGWNHGNSPNADDAGRLPQSSRYQTDGQCYSAQAKKNQALSTVNSGTGRPWGRMGTGLPVKSGIDTFLASMPR